MLKTVSIEYELKNGSVKKANILGQSEEDSVKFLQKITKNGVARINNMGFDMTIHGITDNAMDYINSKTSKKKEIKTDDLQKESDMLSYKCPWCEKSFDKPASLKSHMNRMHNVKEII